ncbi:hypothetical protein GQ600_14162 [Phytophthora cactorum]|nr:hypothetical protein GQ600_14162 [Phytophthora cactorum]
MIAETMPHLERMCKNLPESSKRMVRCVLDRLAGIHELLQTRKDAMIGIEEFKDVFDLFNEMLTRGDLGKKTSNGSAIANFCASRAAAQNVIIVHVEIDRLLVLAELHDASAEAQTPRAHMTLADVGKVLPTPLALLPIFETFMTGRSTGTRFAENSFGPIELALRIRRN